MIRNFNKFISGEYTISYLFGRLDFYKKILQFKNKINNSKKPPKYFSRKIVFKDKNEKIVKELANQGFYSGIRLNNFTVKKILSIIKKLRVFHTDKDGTVYAKFKKPIYLKNRAIQIPRAYIEKVNQISEIRKLSRDFKCKDIFYKYFGYYPKTTNAIILVNYPIKMKVENRLEFETVKYHYDMESPNSLYFSYYLCDVDQNNAPHALIKKTHKNKPLKFVLKSAMVDNDKIFKYYKKTDEVILMLKKGEGFIEDASIYHKNFPARNKIRLMLQIRYY